MTDWPIERTTFVRGEERPGISTEQWLRESLELCDADSCDNVAHPRNAYCPEHGGIYDPPVKFPDVEVQLVGQDGNVFNVIGQVSRALKRAGHADAAAEFSAAAFGAGSYDEVLRLAMTTVDVS